MSAQEIIEELTKLDPEQLRMVQARLDELAARQFSAANPAPAAKEPMSDFLKRIAGTAEGLPSDLAENHDHYLYGTPPRTPR